jgi:branched-chain amino acid aminotransferase
MKIIVERVSPDKMKPKPKDESQLGFGKIFSDHFFQMKYAEKQGWHDALIEGYHDLCLDPAAVCLHYGQLIFEGMKAYRGKDGSIYLFRPADNIKRMNDSAERLCMPTLDVDFTVNALKQLVMIEKEWIPKSSGASMYIRPTMIATEAFLGVKPAAEYTFFIIVGPVGPYYPQGFSPTKIFVTEEYVRAAQGGIGFCKAAGNYAASLLASKKAGEMGYTQVLWLDGVQHKYVEEVGTSNIFFLIDGELITPPLAGTILPGVTRDSVLQIARKWGMKVAERRISIDEVINASQKGTLQEAFASGTAAIVSPIGLFYYKGTEYSVNGGRIGQITEKLYNEILQIQYGEKDDPFGWRMKLSD